MYWMIRWMIHCHCFLENLRQNKVEKITTNYLPALNGEKVSDKLRGIGTIKNQTENVIGLPQLGKILYKNQTLKRHWKKPIIM